MATGAPGTNGVWLYGEDDSEATFSALLNKAGTTVNTQLGLDRTRLTSLEQNGRIVQTVQGRSTTAFSSTATTLTTLTGMTATITPRNASNQILVIVTMNGNFSGADSGRRNIISIFRGETNLSDPTSPGNKTPSFGGFQNLGINTSNISTFSASVLDSPATTSATTYTVRTRMESGDTLFINRVASESDTPLWGRGISTITLLEVKA